MGRIWRLAGLLPLALTGGCTTADLVDTLTPHDGYRVVADQVYAPGPRHGLDVYLPDEPDANHPVVVFFYGGNWQSGDRAAYRFVGQALAARGIVVVIPDYRLYPAALYPDFLDDGAQAVAWTAAHAATFGGDPRRIYLMGHSAGAYIAAMLTLDRRWLGTTEIAGMIGLAGPYDFRPMTDPTLAAIFGPAALWHETQPIAYARGGAPPLLLLTGDDDDTVDPGNTTRLAARVRAAGGRVVEKHYTSAGHLKIIGALAAAFRFVAPTFSDTVNFIDAAQRLQPKRDTAK